MFQVIKIEVVSNGAGHHVFVDEIRRDTFAEYEAAQDAAMQWMQIYAGKGHPVLPWQ